MKVCPTCKIEKEYSEFNKDKSCKCGYSCYCKLCNFERSRAYMKTEKYKLAQQNYKRSDESIKKQKLYKKSDAYKEYQQIYKSSVKSKLKDKEYRDKNKEKIKTYAKELRNTNEYKIYYKNYRKEYDNKNKESIKKQNTTYKLKNKDKIQKQNKEYYKKNRIEKAKKAKKYREEYPEKQIAWRKNNKTKMKAWSVEYYKKNKDKINKQNNKLVMNRRKTNHVFVLKCRVRGRITMAFKNKGYKKTSHTHELLGCDWNTLKSHIESQFTEGMNWDNRSEWHIDHIIPYAIADTKDEIEILSYYENLQPLWAEDNLRKSGSFE